MIEITNNLVELHVAQLIDMQMRQISWKYDYDSVAGGKNKHWHVFAGHDIEECNKNGFEFVEPIWNSIQKKYEVDMERVYFNAHTHGIEPHIHQDDGDVTMIYYPRLDWRGDWGGGTCVQETGQHPTLLQYEGSRLIAFTADLFHQGMPVSRECYQLRTCIVFKTTWKDKTKSKWYNRKKNMKFQGYDGKVKRYEDMKVEIEE
jgi:hypothetical protein